jgi:hypothetical protein
MDTCQKQKWRLSVPSRNKKTPPSLKKMAFFSERRHCRLAHIIV